MNILKLFALATLAVAVWPAERTLAGPDWVEDNDAGHVPPSAQKPTGSGSMSTIYGTLDPAANTAAAGDFVDMYLIYISDPAAFSAQTFMTTGVPGSAEFDSQLWLFDHMGRGILANDDGAVGQSGSRLLSAATDQTAKTIPGPGFYYLAISAFDTDPFSIDGEAIFNQQLRTEISGPDGPGGDRPVASWGTSSQGGTYLIAVTGVEFPPEIPATSTWGFVALFCATAVAGTLVIRKAPLRVLAKR